MATEKTQKSALDVFFDQHPDVERCFVTPDGQIFYTEQSAHNHAQRFDKKKYETVVNPKFGKAENTPEGGNKE